MCLIGLIGKVSVSKTLSRIRFDFCKKYSIQISDLLNICFTISGLWNAFYKFRTVNFQIPCVNFSKDEAADRPLNFLYKQ